MAEVNELQAQLRALEEQLERKRLEEEIAELQRQLANKGSIAVNSISTTAPNSSGNDGEEEEYEEEYIEEILDDDYEEEVVVEIEETIAASPRVTTCAHPKAHSPGQPSAKKPTVRPSSDCTRNTSNHTATKASQASALPPDAPKEDTAAMYEELRQLEEELRRKQLEKEVEELERQMAAMAGAGPSEQPSSPVKQTARKSIVAKPSGPFKQRVIPNVDASPTGQETPMELLLGPKLYKNGKLIATTTKAGCDGQQLILLFFAASWNRLCKPFFPKVLDFYKLVNQAHGVECIYVSTDRNLNEFKDAFAKMPYLAMPTGTAEYKNRIAKELKILDVPFLVVLDAATAHVITTNGVDLVDRLERGNWEQASALVEDWKRAIPVPLDQVQLDKRLVNGVMERGILYWHN